MSTLAHAAPAADPVVPNDAGRLVNVVRAIIALAAVSLLALAAVPELIDYAGSVENLVGSIVALAALSLLAALVFVFKPFIIGLFRATSFLLRSRESVEQRGARRRLAGMLLLTRMAKDVESIQPGLAAELRCLAGRD